LTTIARIGPLLTGGKSYYSTHHIPSGYAVEAATPLPAELPLLATGLGALALLGWRRKRKAA